MGRVGSELVRAEEVGGCGHHGPHRNRLGRNFGTSDARWEPGKKTVRPLSRSRESYNILIFVMGVGHPSGLR